MKTTDCNHSGGVGLLVDFNSLIYVYGWNTLAFSNVRPRTATILQLLSRIAVDSDFQVYAANVY